mmetsp:Transcript_43335/g.135739  ORF Transcript_43335/g.135739 Transcript_43335/m.135739 type:complete len:209 (-) Transcript_43335:900-1526(-)
MRRRGDACLRQRPQGELPPLRARVPARAPAAAGARRAQRRGRARHRERARGRAHDAGRRRRPGLRARAGGALLHRPPAHGGDHGHGGGGHLRLHLPHDAAGRLARGRGRRHQRGDGARGGAADHALHPRRLHLGGGRLPPRLPGLQPGLRGVEQEPRGRRHGGARRRAHGPGQALPHGDAGGHQRALAGAGARGHARAAAAGQRRGNR